MTISSNCSILAYIKTDDRFFDIVENLLKNVNFNDVESISTFENNNNCIIWFSRTFLSNFYPVPILYEWHIYPSVEHGYQAQKFDSDVFKYLDQQQLAVLNELLKNKWHCILITRESTVFENPWFASWTIKIIANYLKEIWFVLKNREDEKFEVMLTLLLKKFDTPQLLKLLCDTWGSYLIEWNTRWDVYWWWSQWTGKNYLGKILMYIRSIN